METNSTSRPFNRRAFISIGMFLSALTLPLSGLMNHRLQFDAFTAQRHFWMSVHNSSAILFSILAVWHIALNWRPLLHHARQAAGAFLSREALLAILLVVLLVGFVSSHALHVP
jgi:hypothetical protein